jgi:hypothetical protein
VDMSKLHRQSSRPFLIFPNLPTTTCTYSTTISSTSTELLSELRVFTGKIPAALRYTTKLTRQHGLPYYSCPVPSRVSQVTKVSITSIDMS